MTRIVWLNRKGERREHSMGFRCSYAYAMDWFRRSILECQGILSVDERREMHRNLRLLEVRGAVLEEN